MKKFLSLLLSVLLILPLFALPSYAAESPDPVAAELSSDTVARVKEEVLTGNITNHEDVLKVALAQYEAATKARTYSRSSTPIDEDAPLTITQLVDSTTDENGVTTETIAHSSLLVLDENERSVSATEYEYYVRSNSGGNNTYSVYATITLHVTTRTNDPIENTTTARATHLSTVLTYGTAITASSLQHSYYDRCDGFGADYYECESDIVYNPAAGYHSFSLRDSRWIPRYNPGLIKGTVTITVGTTTFTVVSSLETGTNWDPFLV